MGGSEQLARLAGALAGLGLAFAAAFPFTGVPPHGVAGRPVPAQVEVRSLAVGELELDPVGTILPATAFPAPGAHGGPTVSVVARNISPLPLALSIRLTGLSPSLDDAAVVRGSGAGAVLIDGPLKTAGTFTKPAGLLPSGAKTTLRFRFKLKPGIPLDAYSGRLDIRQLEIQCTPVPGATPTTPVAGVPGTTVVATTPGAAATTPVATTPGTTPGAAASTPSAAKS